MNMQQGIFSMARKNESSVFAKYVLTKCRIFSPTV